MRIAKVVLKSLSPYSQSRRVDERQKKEPWDEYEKRIWKDRCHYTDDGHVFIPPMSFKRSLEKAAGYLRIRIPGQDRSEYTKHFKSGILVTQGPVLPVTRDTLQGEWLYLSSRGKAGQTDVLKCEPIIREWTATVEFYVLNDIITTEVFEYVLREAGNFIGIGRFRPENGGYYGRYQVVSVEWVEA